MQQAELPHVQTSDEWLVFLLCQILDVDFIGDSAGHKKSKVYHYLFIIKLWPVDSLRNGSILPNLTVKYSIWSIYTKWAKLWLLVQVGCFKLHELKLTKRNRIADEVDFCKCKFHPTCELSREPLLTCLLLLHWIWILRESRTKEGNFCKYIEWVFVFFLNCSWLQCYCMMFDV